MGALSDLFNKELELERRRPIRIWHGEGLVAMFDSVDPSTIYPNDRAGFGGYGQFFSIYGAALDGRVAARTIEKHSRSWLSVTYDSKKLLVPAIEAATLANVATNAGNLYVAFQVKLALTRVALDAVFASTSRDRPGFLTMATEAIAQAVLEAKRFSDYVWMLRELAFEKKLVRIIASAASFAAYPLLCTELGEALVLVYFGSNEASEREQAFERLRKVVTIEPGIANVFTDSQAVSVALICRALAAGNEIILARGYLKRVAFHVLNLYANRLGMASIDDDEQSEIERLVGVEFPEVRPQQRNASFMGTAIVDLCAFLNDGELYRDVVNDLRYHHMYPEYYRPLDTQGQFRLEADDVVRSVNVKFKEELDSEFGYAPHLVDEPRSFSLYRTFGPVAFMCISLLLRDRYFPTTWGPRTGIPA